jgi:hypothetical protein
VTQPATVVLRNALKSLRRDPLGALAILFDRVNEVRKKSSSGKWKRTSEDRVFRVSILRLFTVFSLLIWDGWLTAKDLVGLQPDKIANIKIG